MNGHRDWGGPSDEHQPVTWFRGYPIYAAHLIVLVFVTLMIATAVMGNAAGTLGSWLAFDSGRVFAGQIWRIFTYGLFNPPSLGFAIDMLMIVWFGRELEKTFGRRTFFGLYGGIYVVPTLVLTIVGLLRPTATYGQPGALALFVAFATLLPGAALMFGILAMWAAIILVALYSLIALADRNWIALVLLWSTCGYAFLFVLYQQGKLTLPEFRVWKRKPVLRVLPDLPGKNPVPVKPVKEDATMAEVDALLDKIAKSGMSSLTPGERAKLEAAREGLMKRAAGRG